MDASIPLKQCARKENCINPLGSWLPRTGEHFHADNSKEDKLCTVCKVCRNATTLQWRKDNSERTQQGDIAKKRKRPDVYRAIQQRYRDTHREQCNAASKLSEKRNPLPRQAATLRRVALKRQAEGTYSTADIYLLLEEQCDLCGYCGIRLHGKFEIDHCIPLTRGGANWPDNLILACATCNKTKQDKTFDEWTKVRGW